MKTIVLVALTAVFFFQLGTYLGEKKGQSLVIDTKNPSEELELACLGLWVGEQNKRYWRSQQGS